MVDVVVVEIVKSYCDNDCFDLLLRVVIVVMISSSSGGGGTDCYSLYLMV